MKIEKLLKQKAEIEARIAAAEVEARNKNRVERFVVREVGKHASFFSADPSTVEKVLADAITQAAKNV